MSKILLIINFWKQKGHRNLFLQGVLPTTTTTTTTYYYYYFILTITITITIRKTITISSISQRLNSSISTITISLDQ